MVKEKLLQPEVPISAKEKAKHLFSEHYLVLFDSDSGKGQEIQVSILAKKAALITAKEMLKACKDSERPYYLNVEKEVKKVY